MNKEFLPYEKVRNNALKMAYRIHQDGFIPDIIYVSLRGGRITSYNVCYTKFLRA